MLDLIYGKRRIAAPDVVEGAVTKRRRTGGAKESPTVLIVTTADVEMNAVLDRLKEVPGYPGAGSR